MTDSSTTPLNLMKANLALQSRLLELTESTGRQWLDLLRQLLHDGVVANTDSIQKLLAAGDWQSLVTLPTGAFWRQLQQHLGDDQALVQSALKAQASLVSGLQDALRIWQQDVAGAVVGGTAGQSFSGAGWEQLFKPWQDWVSHLNPPPAKGAKK